MIKIFVRKTNVILGLSKFNKFASNLILAKIVKQENVEIQQTM